MKFDFADIMDYHKIVFMLGRNIEIADVLPAFSFRDGRMFH
jgi:hypothetical protein